MPALQLSYQPGLYHFKSVSLKVMRSLLFRNIYVSIHFADFHHKTDTSFLILPAHFLCYWDLRCFKAGAHILPLWGSVIFI